MIFIFPSIGNVVIPIDELIFFRGVETTNQFGSSEELDMCDLILNGYGIEGIEVLFEHITHYIKQYGDQWISVTGCDV